MAEKIVPVHPSEILVEEMGYRGFDRAEIAGLMGGDYADTLARLDYYIEFGPNDPDLLLDDDLAVRLSRAFDVSDSFFLNLELEYLRAVNAEAESCQGCGAGRKGRFWHCGLLMCWVCRWVRMPLPCWCQPIINFVDRSGGKPQKQKAKGL